MELWTKVSSGKAIERDAQFTESTPIRQVAFKHFTIVCDWSRCVLEKFTQLAKHVRVGLDPDWRRVIGDEAAGSPLGCVR
jgi:hypothetical protein